MKEINKIELLVHSQISKYFKRFKIAPLHGSAHPDYKLSFSIFDSKMNSVALISLDYSNTIISIRVIVDFDFSVLKMELSNVSKKDLTNSTKLKLRIISMFIKNK